MVDEPNECEAVRVTMCVCGFFSVGCHRPQRQERHLVRGAVFVVEAEIKLKSTHNLRSGNDVKKLEKTVNFFVSRNCNPKAPTHCKNQQQRWSRLDPKTVVDCS
jgi:hypothetical protein